MNGAGDDARINIERVCRTICELLSLFSAPYVASVCLRREHCWKVTAKLLIYVAAADWALRVWCYIVPCMWYGSLLYPGAPPWCITYIYVRRCLDLQSALFSACIACGVLAAMLHRVRFVAALRHAPLAVIPLASLLALADLARPAEFRPGFSGAERVQSPLPMCITPELPQRIYAAEIGAIFSGMLPIHLMAIRRLRQAAPASVVARCIRSAIKYLSAFACSYVLYGAMDLLWCSWLDVKGSGQMTTAAWASHLAIQQVNVLHAAFVLLAVLTEQRWALVGRIVTFRSTDSLRSGGGESEVPEAWLLLSLHGTEPAPSEAHAGFPSCLPSEAEASELAASDPPELLSSEPSLCVAL